MIDEKVRIVEKRKSGIFTLHLREDGILHRHVSGIGEYKLEIIPELNKLLKEMLNGKAVPVLITADDMLNTPPEARSVGAKKISRPYSLAEAYLTKSAAHQLLLNFYINNDKPERPTRVFEDKEEAIIWLKKFL